MHFKFIFKKITMGLFLFGLLTTGAVFAQNAPLGVKGDLEAFGNLKVVNQFGHVVFADQPDKETVGMLKEKGIDLVLSIRGLNEKTGFDERKTVEENGMAFLQIPYMKGRGIDENALNEIMDVINSASKNGTKIMLHCTHSQRAGSVLGAALYRDFGYSKEEANKIAKEAGMTSEFLTKIHNEYLETLK